MGYCLKYKDWSNHCPVKCGECVSGEVGELEVTEQKKYNIECLHFTREMKKGLIYFCTLMMQEEPFCDLCQFPIYKEIPVKGRHISNS